MSDQIIPQATWQPRWYYVMRNKTSGKKYAGQTVRENMDKYCGSGGYWRAHCKKHGGLDRQNIEVLEQVWVADKTQAQQWLDSFAAENGDYWLRENTIWANACKESVEDSPFAGLTDNQRKTNAKAGGDVGGKKNVESGHWARISSLGAQIGGKTTGKKNVESGHLARVRTKEVQSKAGKIGGKIAVESGRWEKCRKTSAENFRLKFQFCKVFDISSPGRNFINIDKAAFLAWKESLTQVSEIG
jgi:hypothetical protein